MRKLNSKELREEWIKFYEERGHKNIPDWREKARPKVFSES